MTTSTSQPAPVRDDGKDGVHSGPRPGNLPPVETLVRGQAVIRGENLTWMETCRELCRLRLPAERFERVPPGVWRFHPWGHRVVVMRTPRFSQQGKIILAQESQQSNTSGWVLSVGENICGEARGTSLQAGSSPYTHPLLLVGELVLFNPYGGRALTMNALDEGFIHRTGLPELLICGVGDIYGPNVDPQWFDYAAEQPSILLDSTGEPT